MPVKKRLPKDRNFQITPGALDAFRKMEAPNCTSDDWWAAHSILHDELKLKPWDWPAFEHPDEKCPYPDGCEAARHWQAQRDGRPEAFELYRELVRASKADPTHCARPTIPQRNPRRSASAACGSVSGVGR